jgi:suppressor of ftsI
MRPARTRLIAGVAAIATLAVAGCGGGGDGAGTNAAVAEAAAKRPVAWKPKRGLPFQEPQQLRARDGVLDVELVARRDRVLVSGSPVVVRPFNGQFIGPTLRVRPGDTIRATIRNEIRARTNIHWHGLHVSPKGVSDNVFRTFEPGATVRSIVRLPRDHEPGTFWYHVHFHGTTEGQVAGGLSGLLIVEGLEDLLPEPLRGVEQRQFALRDLQLARPDRVAMTGTEADPFVPMTRLVNGLLRPRVELGSGETQMWRLANVGSDIFYWVALDGHDFTVIAEDGSPVWETYRRTRLLIPPGKRFDVLVQGGRPGSYKLKTFRYQGFAPQQPTVELARVRVTGPERAPDLELPASLPQVTRRLDDATVTSRRRFSFTLKTSGRFEAFINGRRFDPTETGVAPVLGTVEEWTLVNPSDEDHPFHIHVNDFQVMSVNGRPYDAKGLQDVVIVPRGGEVVVRHSFDDFPGHFVFHCHILGHEDAGMMKTVQVVRPGERPTPPPGAHAHHDHH